MLQHTNWNISQCSKHQQEESYLIVAQGKVFEKLLFGFSIRSILRFISAVEALQHKSNNISRRTAMWAHVVRPLSSISRMYSIIRLQKPARHVRKLAPSKTTKLQTKEAAPTPTETCSSFFWTTARHIEAAASSALSNIWKNQFNSRLPYDYTSYTTNFSEKITKIASASIWQWALRPLCVLSGLIGVAYA